MKITKFLKSFKENNKGLIEIIYIAIYLGLAVAAGAITLFIAGSVVDLTALPPGTPEATATGTMLTSGNFTDGELITVAGVVFEVNTSVPNCSPQNACVNATDVIPVTVIPALVQGITVNGTTTLLVTALTLNATAMSVTAVSPGSAGNSIGTSDNATNTTWTGATLLGGVDGIGQTHLYNASENLLDAADTGYSFLPIVAVAAIGAIAIGYVFGLIPGMGKSKGGGGGI